MSRGEKKIGSGTYSVIDYEKDMIDGINWRILTSVGFRIPKLTPIILEPMERGK